MVSGESPKYLLGLADVFKHRSSRNVAPCKLVATPLMMNCAFMCDGPSLLKDTCFFIFNSFKSEVKLLNLTDVKTKKK